MAEVVALGWFELEQGVCELVSGHHVVSGTPGVEARRLYVTPFP